MEVGLGHKNTFWMGVEGSHYRNGDWVGAQKYFLDGVKMAISKLSCVATKLVEWGERHISERKFGWSNKKL